MKGIIIYKSNYGSTEQYANWLSEDTGFRSMEIKKVRKRDFYDCDVVILGSPIFAGKPLITGWIRKKWQLLKGHKVILFTTSGANSDDPLLQKNFESTFETEIKDGLRYFPQGGRMVQAELTRMHSFLMNLGKKMEKDPAIREEMDRDKDYVNRDGIKPILEFVL